jgi:hypothetical protein
VAKRETSAAHAEVAENSRCALAESARDEHFGLCGVNCKVNLNGRGTGRRERRWDWKSE